MSEITAYRRTTFLRITLERSSESILEAMREWGLGIEKLVAITTDSGSNLVCLDGDDKLFWPPP